LENGFQKSEEEKPKNDKAVPMSDRSVISLAVYLLAIVVLSFYLVYALWSAQPQAEMGPVPAPDCKAVTAPAFAQVYPARVAVGGAQDVWVIGCGFTGKTQVKINAAAHQALFMDASHIRVSLAPADLLNPGSALIALADGEAVFDSRALAIVPAGVLWQPFGLPPRPLSQEVQFLLLVLIVGVLGSTIYALKSMANYRGDRRLEESWFMYYAVQPFEGAGMAFLFYLLIRGGFLAGAGADVKTANLFGICAIAGLAGTFSDMAFRKLREVFETLFKPQDNRGGKTGPRITTKSLADAVVGQPYSSSIHAAGGVAPFKWSVSPTLPAGLSLDATAGTISGTPSAASPKTAYQFMVTDSAPSPVSANVSLEMAVTTAGSETRAHNAANNEEADGCAVEVTHATLDEDLPPTEGGVA